MDVEKRGSPRFAVRAYLLAEWNHGEHTLAQEVVTESISTHGALLKLAAADPPHERVFLTNPLSHQTQGARVVSIHSGETAGTWDVRVEFETPAPEFWGREAMALLDEVKPGQAKPD